jgi:hypothetical protein
MEATRQQASTQNSPRAALDHVLTTVLDARDGSPYHLALALAGVQNINDLLSLEPSDISELSYISASDDEDATVRTLNLIERKKLIALRSWYYSHNSPTIALWYNLTADTFEDYRTTTLPLAPTLTMT